MARGRRSTLTLATVGQAIAAVGLAIAAVGLAPAGAEASRRLPTLPDAPKPMILAQRLAEALSPDLGGPPSGDPAGNPATALARVTAALAADSGQAAADGSAPRQLVPGALGAALRSCDTLDVLDSMTGSGTSTSVVIKSTPTSFAISAVPTTWWTTPPVPLPVWQLYFRGLMWEENVAQVALGGDDSAAIDALVATAAASVAANPDPGKAINGWDEGTNLRRQQALNCLYRASDGDPRLIPAMTATATANMDTARYYGLPNHWPHNHGTMANLALLDAGDLLDNPAWKSVAVHRLLTDSGGAFTAGGVSIEQSSSYHVGNSDLWAQVADTLAAYPDTSVSGAAAAIRTRVALARSATSYMIDPVGHLVPYGDADDEALSVIPQPRGAFRDDAAGLVTGRWSWTDPQTSFYLLRYGPARWAHGHYDHGELAWTTRGVRVLVDPGMFSYDPGPYATFQSSAVAHNTQVVSGRTMNARGAMAMVATTTSGLIHSYITTDADYGLKHTRNWRIDSALHRVSVTDVVAAPAVSTLHFDMAWTAITLSADHKALTLRHPSGRIATVRSSSPMTVYRSSTRPVLGWQFGVYGQRWGDVQVLMNEPAGTSGISVTLS